MMFDSHAAILFGIALLMIMAACSSPISDNEDATSTPTAETSSSLTPAESGPEPSGTPANLDEPPTEETVSETASTAPSATESNSSQLPENGAELLIEGQPITRIFPGSETGRTMYAVASDRLWRTNDGGRTWADAGAGNIDSLAVAINEQNVLYTGDRGGCGRGFSFFEFQRSTDAGRSWETIAENVDIEPYLAYESSQNALVYGSNCGLSVSTDGGTTWKLVPDLNGEEIFAVATERTDPMAQVIVVAATEGGTGRLFLLDSIDTANPQFVSALTQYWGDAAVDWTDGRIVLATAHQVGVSDDSGATWSWSRDGLEDATFSVDPLFDEIPEAEINPFRRFEVARIDPTNRDRIWIGGTHGAYVSVDGGESWEQVGDKVEITGLVLTTLSNRVLISSDSGTRLWALDER